MSNEPLREELRNILNIVADLSHNNTNASVKDVGVIQEAKPLPRNNKINIMFITT